MNCMQDMQGRAAARPELVSEYQNTIHIVVSETIIKAITVVIHPWYSIMDNFDLSQLVHISLVFIRGGQKTAGWQRTAAFTGKKVAIKIWDVHC